MAQQSIRSTRTRTQQRVTGKSQLISHQQVNKQTTKHSSPQKTKGRTPVSQRITETLKKSAQANKAKTKSATGPTSTTQNHGLNQSFIYLTGATLTAREREAERQMLLHAQ